MIRDRLFLILMIVYLSYVSGMKIKLINMNDSIVVYQNDTLSDYFHYQKHYDICDCSPKLNYFEQFDVMRTNFEIELKGGEKIVKIIAKSTNGLIKLGSNYTFENDHLINLSVDHICLNNSDSNTEKKYWGVIKVEIIKSIETLDKIKFEFVKFCQPPELMGSILTITILFFMSTVFVAVSTYSEISVEISDIKPEGEIKNWHGVALIISGSIVLILIFYFVEYINIFFTMLVTFQIGLSFYLCVKTFYEFLLLNRHKRFMKWNRKIKLNGVYFGEIAEIEIYSVLIFIMTIIMVTIYLITRHWVLNNILGFCLVFTILSLFHIRSFKICSIILFSAFLYDVFWVYLSPFFFNKNVMVFAATSINLPIKLEMPILFDTHPLKSCMFLGLGDLVLPGLVIKFCHRFDFIKNTNVYYLSSLFLYVFALALSGFVIAVFKYPQPVLFYMCPVLLMGISLISWKRKETDIWHSDLLEENLEIIFDNTEIGIDEIQNNNIDSHLNSPIELECNSSQISY